MAIEDFLNHKCNIFHLVTSQSSPGYGFENAQDKTFSYSSTPDEEDIDCHFHTKSNSATLEQNEPNNNLVIVRKLTLPIGTDIRMNDKVVECESGLEYTARKPLNIRDHHISVTIYRTERQKPI